MQGININKVYMKRLTITLMTAMAMLMAAPATAQTNEKPFVIPELREWKGGEGAFTPGEAMRIVYPAKDEALKKVATQLAKDNGFASLSNMILTGKVLKEIDIVAYEGNRETLESFIPAKKAGLIDMNIQALQIGYDY